MTTTPLPASITIGSVPIHQRNGLYSLNDLHQASGGEDKHRPNYFLTNAQTQPLITTLDEAGNPASKILEIVRGRGKAQGTYVYGCKELVIAYASWISAAFHLKVIRVFLDNVASAQPKPIQTKTLTFTAPANDRTSRWLLHTDRQGQEVVTELSPETHVITTDQLVQRLMQSPGDLNLTQAQMLTIINACLNSMQTGLNAMRVKAVHTPST